MRLLRSYGVELVLIMTLALAVAFFGYLAVGLLPRNVVSESFNGRRALANVERQVAFGARATGTRASIEMSEWLINQLTGLGWDVVIQEFAVQDPLRGRNVIAIRSPQTPSAGVAMLATHYDTRLAADADPDPAQRTKAAPGANNGASGAAVLLELARTLDVDAGGHTVCLAFLDAEANEEIPGWLPWLGSRQLAGSLSRDVLRCASPRFVVALDQVGAPDARFAPDPAAAPWINDALWTDNPLPDPGGNFAAGQAGTPLVNSHTAFAAAGFQTGLISDRAYALARTTADLPAVLSAQTLETVGRRLESWMESGAPVPTNPGPGAAAATPAVQQAPP